MADIKGIDKAKILAALYNNSQPLGLGILHYVPGDMSEEEARELLTKHKSFDYLKGRVMKIDLTDDEELDTRLYNRDNGVEAAEKVLANLV